MLNLHFVRFVVAIFSAGVTALGASVVCGQDASTGSGQVFPNKSIRMISAPAGSGTDVLARLFVPALSSSLGQQIIVDNRGGDIIPGEIVAKAPPDGYTLNLSGGSFWLVPFLYSNVPWDSVKDFSPVTLVASSPSILAVHPSVAATSVKELIALAKAKPGQLNYGSSGAGGSSHLSAELFKSMADVNIVRIPYKGGGLVTNDLLSGHVQLAFSSSAGTSPHIKSGKLRGLGITSAQPSALVPGLPTIAASGLPGYESATTVGLFAPAKTPVTVINRLNQEIVRTLNRADMKERFLNAGVEAVGSSPEQLAAAMKSDIAKLGKLIKDKGIRAE